MLECGFYQMKAYPMVNSLGELMGLRGFKELIHQKC